MVLSIGMIVKNEEKYLERCLSALQPILNELDSELIIADTGSTDSTVEIAKKFTDNVFHFEWINDFAAARNSTLEKAKGEWYMFIDADEILQDCSDLIDFFKSGEYKRYKSASYVVSSFNNVADPENTRLDFNVLRLAENNGVTKFQNAIHELLYPLFSPTRELKLIADHYGYLYFDKDQSTELAYKKSKRNLDYMFKELEEKSDEEINNTRYFIYDQIADCYCIIKENDKALSYLDTGLKKLNHKNFGIIAYYSHKIFLLGRPNVIDKNVNEIIDLATEYLDPKLHPWHAVEYSTDCYVYAMRAYSYYKVGNYDKAIDDFIKFFDLYDKHLKGKLNREDLLLTTWRISDSQVYILYDLFFRSCFHTEKFALADHYTKYVQLEKYFGNPNPMINHLKIRVEIMEAVGYKKLDSLYKQLDEFGKNYLISLVRTKAFNADPSKRAVITGKLASLGGMPSELANIYAEYFTKGSEDFGLVESFLKKHGSEDSEDMLYILLEKQMDISPFLLTEDFNAERAAQLLISYFPNGADLYESYNIDKISSNDALIKAVDLYVWVLRKALEANHKISKLFKIYGDLGAKWDRAFPNSLSVPGNIRAAQLSGEVVKAIELGDRAAFNAAMNDLTTIVPDLIPIANAYEDENSDSLKPDPELEQLAAQAKQIIRSLISMKNLSEAKNLLEELERISPDDPDIEVLRKEIDNTL